MCCAATTSPCCWWPTRPSRSSRYHSSNEFYELGLGEEIFPISSQTGYGTGELLDKVVEYFDAPGVENPEEGIPRIAIVGRPNVGKSSFLNVLTGTERSIVTDIAGTTRDAIHTPYKAFGREYILIDTAGMRRKSRVKEDIEFYSTIRSIKAMEESDVCIVMLDAENGLEGQDMTLIGQADKAKKGIVVMVNKWDAVEKDSKTADQLKKAMLERLAPMNYMPIIFASVLEKQRIFQVMEKAMEVYENRQRKITTSKLNEVMQEVIANYPPPAFQGQAHQDKVHDPVADALADVRVFLQFPQVHQGTLRALPRKPDARALRLHGRADHDVFSGKIGSGCSGRRASRNLDLDRPRLPSR